MRVALVIQIALFLVVAVLLIQTEPRLAIAQALLAAVNTLLFWEVLSA